MRLKWQKQDKCETSMYHEYKLMVYQEGPDSWGMEVHAPDGDRKCGSYPKASVAKTKAKYYAEIAMANKGKISESEVEEAVEKAVEKEATSFENVDKASHLKYMLWAINKIGSIERAAVVFNALVEVMK